jgi:hypothetical protein
MFKIRVRWRTALALCLWALSVSWIPSSAVAGSECGSGAPVVTQRAPWGGKSSPREGAAQVVVRMMVTAGEMRAGEPENGLDAERRRSLRQQVAGEPQIDDAPIGLRKAVGDPPALHTTTVDGAGLRGRDVCNGSPVAGRGGNRGVGRRQRPQWRGGSGRLQQGVGLWRQPRTGVQQSDPGSMAARSAPRGFPIGETGESSQMAPVGARRIAAVSMRQPLAGSGRHSWFQRTGNGDRPRPEGGRGWSAKPHREHAHGRAWSPTPLAARRPGRREYSLRFDPPRRGRDKHRIPRGCGRAETGGSGHSPAALRSTAVLPGKRIGSECESSGPNTVHSALPPAVSKQPAKSKRIPGRPWEPASTSGVIVQR